MRLRIPQSVEHLADIFRRAGFQCHLVGGAVRDLFLRRGLTDFDIATDAQPEQVRQLFRRVIPTGIKHGTVTVLFEGERFEVTTFRTDGVYTDGRRPDTVSFTPSITEDLARRDFTINGIAYDLAARLIIDPHDGRGDMRRRLIRAIGDPAERFAEDGLRPVRACRFAAQLSFTIDPATMQAMADNLDKVAAVSSERIRDELTRILQSENLVHGFELLRESGLLSVVAPELAAGIGVDQRERHCFDVFYHSLHTAAATPAEDLGLRLAGLLHDVGKVTARVEGPEGDVRFPSHDRESARLAEELMRRLRLPNATIDRVVLLVGHHMFDYQDSWSDTSVRRLVAKVGKDHIHDLIRLRRADQVGRCNRPVDARYLDRLTDRVDRLLADDEAVALKDLVVDGREIMDALAIPPGREVGVVLDFLLEAVIEDPRLNDRATLLEMARRFYRDRVRPDGSGESVR